MDQAKLNFLKKDFIFHLKHLAPDAQGKWGKMNGQQMVEHFSFSVRIASGRLKFPDSFDEEQLKKNLAFVMTEKPFRENTRNPVLSENPEASRHATMQQSIEELQQELDHFFQVYESLPGLQIRSPFYGDMNYEEQVQLLYKHALHHLRQFGLIN